MEKLYVNGTIHTLDATFPLVSALAVVNGRIAALGTQEQVRAAVSSKAQVIDLGGRTVTPAFSDTHMHLISYVGSKREVDLSTADSLEALIETCRAALAAGQCRNGWLIGRSWNQNGWPTPRIPDKHDLDRISTKVPIALSRACYHVTSINSRACELLGLSADCDGILREDEGNCLSAIEAQPTADELMAMIQEGCADLLKQGIVCAHTDDFGESGNYAPVYNAYRSLAEAGKLPVRIVQQCRFLTPEQLERFLSDGHFYGETHGHYRLGEHKLLLDGSLGARTAYMRKPYADDPSTQGIPLFTEDSLYALTRISHAAGFPIAAHAIGDGALEMLLNTVERLQKEAPRKDARHGIVHCQITDQAQLARIAQLNMQAYIQPIFVKADQHITEERVGAALAQTSYAWKTLRTLGIHASGGSDCPVEPFDLLPNLACAVTRKDPTVPGAQPWHAEQCLTVEEAVRCFTEEAAYASFEENDRGTLSVGKLADFAVLSRDIFTIAPDEIGATKVEMTVVDGEIAWEK